MIMRWEQRLGAHGHGETCTSSGGSVLGGGGFHLPLAKRAGKVPVYCMDVIVLTLNMNHALAAAPCLSL